MADANPKVMEMVEAELKKNADISNAELLERARKIDKGVEKLSARQFNATYPLQVKRALNPPKRRARKRKTAVQSKGRSASRSRAGGDVRDRVRGVLLELAKDVANAENKGDVVEVVAGIDRYIDRVVKAAS